MIDLAPPRLVLASADDALCRALTRMLAASGLPVLERALDASGLRAVAQAMGASAENGPCPVALVDARLPGLGPTALASLQALGMAVVLVGPVAPGLESAAAVVPREPEPAALAEAVRRAAARQPNAAYQSRTESTHGPGRHRQIIALTSGHGGPGKTTLAISLAAALAGRDSVVLVDLDLRGGNLAVALGLRPEYNLFQLASATGAGHGVDEAVAAELQEVRPRLRVLAGLAAPHTMLGEVTPLLIERVLRTLAGTHAWVVADLGSDFAGVAGTGHRAALDMADLVLAVAEPSALGLWNLRLALADGGPLASVRARTGVVLNRFHGRFHHAPGEVAAVFPELPVLACIPLDEACTAWALQAQRPLVEDRYSEAAQALRHFAASLAAALPAQAPEAA